MKSGLATKPAISMMAARINAQVENMFPSFSFRPRESPGHMKLRATTTSAQEDMEQDQENSQDGGDCQDCEIYQHI